MTAQKIIHFSTAHLTNLEFVGFHARFRTLFAPAPAADGQAADEGGGASPAGAETEGGEKVAVDGALAAAFDADLALMNDVAIQSRVSQETARLAELGRRRDRCVICVNAVVAGFLYSEEDARREAAVYLSNVLRPCVGLQKLPAAQKTAAADAMLLDLQGDAAARVAALGLEGTVERLRALNAECASLVERRTRSRQSRDLEAARTVRARLTEAYDAICTGVRADDLRAPTALTRRFIAGVNALVADVRASYRQRVALRAAARARRRAALPAGD